MRETTNHDVKAVEYFIRDFFKKDKTLKKYINLIHFGLTSEDVNSLSYAILIKDGMDIHFKKINTINKYIKSLSKKWINIALLSRTHGQPASPSTIGKELKVFYFKNRPRINKIKTS